MILQLISIAIILYRYADYVVAGLMIIDNRVASFLGLCHVHSLMLCCIRILVVVKAWE